MNFSVTQFGVELDKSKYTWCEITKTFSSNENNLVLDFKGRHGVTFNTGSDCTFNTGSYCTFKTGYNCTFKTWDSCTFDTGYSCTFNTGYSCTFDTESSCTFDTWDNCSFKTGSDCTFDTGSDCTFKTGYSCVVVRRDVFEVIQLEPNRKIKLNKFEIKGFVYLDDKKEVIIDGKKIEISAESFNELKKQLLDDEK